MGVNKNKLFKKVFAVSAGLGAFLIGATMTLYEYGPIITMRCRSRRRRSSPETAPRRSIPHTIKAITQTPICLQ